MTTANNSNTVFDNDFRTTHNPITVTVEARTPSALVVIVAFHPFFLSGQTLSVSRYTRNDNSKKIDWVNLDGNKTYLAASR